MFNKIKSYLEANKLIIMDLVCDYIVSCKLPTPPHNFESTSRRLLTESENLTLVIMKNHKNGKNRISQMSHLREILHLIFRCISCYGYINIDLINVSCYSKCYGMYS